MQIENIFLDKVDSTQTFVKKNYLSFDPNVITCVFAEEQTQGIGRFHRKWISFAHKSIAATFYLTISSSIKNITTLGQILALSLATILKKHNLDIKIKWPNDLMINDKKVAGILCETIIAENHFHIFLGIGINVNVDKELISLIDQPATSLQIESKKQWDRTALLKELQEQFLQNLDKFLAKGFNPFHDLFESLLLYMDKDILLFDGQNTYEGRIDSITDSGALKFKLKNDQIKIFQAGDILTR